MDWQETTILIGLFLLRVAVPLLILLGIGELVSRRIGASQQDAGRSPTPAIEQGTDTITHCWEIKNCPLATRETCLAFQRPYVPCWLALQLAGQELPDECLACEVFRRTQPIAVGYTTNSTQGD